MAAALALVIAGSSAAAGQVSLIGIGATYSENFDTLASAGTSSATPVGWELLETGTSANVNGMYAAGTGSNNAGDTYSFGAAGSTERAFGGLLSGTLTPTIGAAFANNTGATITSLDIAYTGEQWRVGTLARADRIDFQFSTSATSLSTGTWADVDSLDFTGPDQGGAIGLRNGNDAANRTAIAGSVTGLSIASGETFWIRWTDFNASGADDGLAVDDFSLTPRTSIENAAVIANCGSGPLVTPQGTPASRQVSASDADGTVTSIAITSVTPSPAPGTITLSNLSPATADGGTATADVNVDGNVPAGTYSVEVSASNDDATPQTGTCTLTVTVEPPDVPIYELQGSGHTSPYAGTQQNTTGVVTVIVGNGFYIQDATGDGNPATSDGIFVFGSSFARSVEIGDIVRVRGTVVEFRPSNRPRDLTLTEFSPTASVTELGTASLPAPVVISNRPDELIDPDGINTFEQLEGMFVSIDTPRVSGGTTDFGEFVVAASGDHANMAAGGNFLLRPLLGGGVDYNPERIMVDDEARFEGAAGARINNPMVPLTVGDLATGHVMGAMDYQFSNYRVQASHLVSSVLPGSPVPATPVANLRDPHPWEGRISSFNVENLFDCLDAPSKGDDHPTCSMSQLNALETQVAKLAAGFEQELERPEIVIVEETENAGVLTGDASGNIPGTTGSARPVQALLPRLSGNWDARSFDASDERGIEVAFVWNTDRVVLHDAYLGTDPVKGIPDGGIFSGSATIRAGREPLVGHFTLDDVDVTIIGNHFKSKGGSQFGVDPLEAGDDPLYGEFQPPVRWTEVQLRHQQADYVRHLVDHLLAGSPGSRILVGGDLNDFEFAEPGEGHHTVARITDSPTAPLTNVVPDVPADERYTFLFEGNSQVLDHMLLNAPLDALRRDQAIGHFNTDYPGAFGPNAGTTVRSSDHDPLVTYFCTDLTDPSLSVTVAPDVLWPPNGKYRTVEATVSATDDRDPSPDVELLSVTSDEPDTGKGYGNKPNDIVIVDEDTFMLRAERGKKGDGRVYTITYVATDACGNSTEASATVTVPKKNPNKKPKKPKH